MRKVKRAKPPKRVSLTRLRREAEAAVDHLIDLLDRIDPFFDEREPHEDCEPSLGSANDQHGNGTTYMFGNGVLDGEGPDDDLEPNLGSGDGRDLELDEADKEPSLGWPEQFGAGGGGLWGGQDDREECAPVGSAAAYARFRASGIDSKETGVKVVRGYGYGSRRLQGLTDAQRKAVRAKVKGPVSVY